MLEPFGKKAADPHDGAEQDPRVPAELLSMLQHRWAGASYTATGQNWTALFNKIDHDHNGELDLYELSSVCRKILKITHDELSDEKIAGEPKP